VDGKSRNHRSALLPDTLEDESDGGFVVHCIDQYSKDIFLS
jgi:hypothetical protein